MCVKGEIFFPLKLALSNSSSRVIISPCLFLYLLVQKWVAAGRNFRLKHITIYSFPVTWTRILIFRIFFFYLEPGHLYFYFSLNKPNTAWYVRLFFTLRPNNWLTWIKLIHMCFEKTSYRSSKVTMGTWSTVNHWLVVIFIQVNTRSCCMHDPWVDGGWSSQLSQP